MKVSSVRDQIKQMFILKEERRTPKGFSFTIEGVEYFNQDEMVVLDIPNKTVIQILQLLDLTQIESLHLQDSTELI